MQRGRLKIRSVSLQCLKKVAKSHATFITGLEFLPTSEEADVIRGFSDASVVSISVDHQICVHHIPRLSEYISFVYFKFNTILCVEVTVVETRMFLCSLPGQISMVAATFILATLLIITFIICSYLGL